MIIKIQKRDNPFAQIDRTTLADSRLSYRARGILAYLLTKPEGWTTRVNDLVKMGTEGRDAIRSALKELSLFGYAVIQVQREKGGKIYGKFWEIHETPFNRPPEKPSDGKSGDILIREGSNKERESKESSLPSESDVFNKKENLFHKGKEAQREKLILRSEIPSEEEFYSFLSENAEKIIDCRGDLYDELVSNKWHIWNPRAQKWKRVADWRKLVKALSAKMEEATEF